MALINLSKIVIAGSEDAKELDRLKQTAKKKEDEQKAVLSAVKDNRIAKQKEKLETAEQLAELQEKKHKSIKKIISMCNNDKPKEDIQKKLGRLLDKYYIKGEELPY